MSTRNTGATNSDVQAKTWLKPEQIERMRDVCLSDAFPAYLQDRNDALIGLLYDTGLRASEACGLDTNHFSATEGTLYLPSELQKGSPHPATLDLDAGLVRTLKRYLRDCWKDSPAMFPSRSSDRLTTRSLRRLVKTVAQEAGVEPQLANGELVSQQTLLRIPSVTPLRIELSRSKVEDLRTYSFGSDTQIGKRPTGYTATWFPDRISG